MSKLILLPGREEQHESSDWWALDAIRSEDLFENTNNRPLLVWATGPSGDRDSWVLKPFANLGGPLSIKELVGARFASWLGIPVPEHAVINVSQQVLEKIDSDRARRLDHSVGPNFGSRFVSGVVELERPGNVARGSRPVACDIQALDVLIDNLDRDEGRSNVLVGNDRLLAIDHEHTFSFFEAVPSAGPVWVIQTLHRLATKHFFANHFPVWVQSLRHLNERLAELDREAVGELTASIPSKWLRGAGADCLIQVETYLLDVSARRDEILGHLERLGAA